MLEYKKTTSDFTHTHSYFAKFSAFDEYISLDFESTGLDPSQDEIIEIGLLVIKKNKIVRQYHQLVKPSVRPRDHILDLTGLKWSQLQQAPRFDEIWQEVVNLIEGYPLIGHRIDFDFNLLQNHLHRFGVKLTNPLCCTKKLTQSFFPSLANFSLKDILNHFTLVKLLAHRALSDALMAYELYEQYIPLLKYQSTSLEHCYFPKHKPWIESATRGPSTLFFYFSHTSALMNLPPLLNKVHNSLKLEKNMMVKVPEKFTLMCQTVTETRKFLKECLALNRQSAQWLVFLKKIEIIPCEHYPFEKIMNMKNLQWLKSQKYILMFDVDLNDGTSNSKKKNNSLFVIVKCQNWNSQLNRHSIVAIDSWDNIQKLKNKWQKAFSIYLKNYQNKMINFNPNKIKFLSHVWAQENNLLFHPVLLKQGDHYLHLIEPLKGSYFQNPQQIKSRKDLPNDLTYKTLSLAQWGEYLKMRRSLKNLTFHSLYPKLEFLNF